MQGGVASFHGITLFTFRECRLCRSSDSAQMKKDLEQLKNRITEIIATSRVPEDPVHSRNTLDWLLELEPDADEALKIAALGHDIERSIEDRKVRHEDFPDFDAFKKAHAESSARILREIMESCGMEEALINEVHRLVRNHEAGGDPRSNLLRDADALSFFDVNLPMYLQREGPERTMDRCRWGYQRLSPKARKTARRLLRDNDRLPVILKCLLDTSE